MGYHGLKSTITGATLLLCAIVPMKAMAVQALSNNAMSTITGQATIQITEEEQNTAYATPTEYAEQKDKTFQFQPALPKQQMVPSTINNGQRGSVLIDFLPVEANASLGIAAEDFNGYVDVGNVSYTDNDTNTSIIMDGSFRGSFTVPSTYAPEMINGQEVINRQHVLKVSRDRLPAGLVDSGEDFIVSYQGTVYTPGEIDDDTESIIATPNRQGQVVGRAGKKPLKILVPRGHGDNTTWHVMTTIPAGRPYIQMDINRLINHHSLKYTIKLANNPQGLNAGDPGSKPGDISGTLGTLYQGGNGSTFVEPGTVVITPLGDGV